MRIVFGVLAGLAGGIVLATWLTVMIVTGPAATMVTLMQLLGAALGHDGLLVGWIAALGAGAVLGGLFALVLGRAAWNPEILAVAALLFGLALWLAEGLVALPLLFQVAPVIGVADPRVWPLIPPMVVPNLLFSSVLAVVLLVFRPRPARATGAGAADLGERRPRAA
jgi:hypothetical protein